MAEPKSVERALAELLRAVADRLDQGERLDSLIGVVKSAPPAAEPTALDLAAAFIRANPGAPGKAIAAAVGIDFGHFRSRIVPRLKAMGFTSGDGYRPPPM